MEKVRGEFTDLLRRLETALTQAQVTGDNQEKKHRCDKLNWGKKSDDLTFLSTKCVMLQGQERVAPRKSCYYYNFPTEHSQTFPKLRSVNVARHFEQTISLQKNVEAGHDKLRR